MRKIKILKVNPTTTVPGSVEISGDFTNIFLGRYYRNSAGLTQPGYTPSPAAGYDAIVATTFDIVENVKYAGRYTVYTPVSSADGSSSTYSNPKTIIRVAEVVPALGTSDAATLATDGSITNISTYLLSTGSANIIVPPGVDITSYPIELMGRNVSGWGEGFAQNFVNLSRNFGSATAPTSPFVGMSWYSTDDQQMRIWNGTAWVLLNQASFGVTFRFTQSAAASTWTVNHGLGLAAPFIAFTQFFVDRGSGPKLIIPADVVFTNANSLTVSFSNAEIGYVLVRP